MPAQYATDFDDWPILAEGDWEQTRPEGTYRSFGCYCNFGNTLSGLRKIGFNATGDILELPPADFPERLRMQVRTSTGSDAELSVQYWQADDNLSTGTWTEAGTCPVRSEDYTPCEVALNILEPAVPLRIVMSRFGNSVFLDDLELLTTFLPVELTSFTARARRSGEVHLHWRTATETGNAWFDVQRSSDGEAFTPIGRRRGAGFSTAPRDYTFLDRPDHPGLWYYRLRQTDTDGSSTHSPIVSVTVPHTEGLLRVYPTAITDRLTIRLPPGDHPRRLTIYDAQGRPARTLQAPPRTREYHVRLPLLPSGRYYLVLQDEGTQQVAWFIKSG